jgi:hypothetical protein
MRKLITISATGLLLGLGTGAVLAAPDWSKVPAKQITLLYPGVSPIEWIMTGTEHGGARGIKKGETCAGCHDEETADMGQKMASGQKIEPSPIKGKAGSIPVSVQAAYDAANVYLRFSWKQPAGGAAKMDPGQPGQARRDAGRQQGGSRWPVRLLGDLPQGRAYHARRDR